MINEQKQQFCEEYVSNGWNATAAYLKIFKCSKKSAGPSSARLMTKDYILDYISQIEGTYKSVAKQYNMDKKFILKKLKRLIDAKKVVFFKGEACGEVEDTSAQNTAITTFLKMTGDIAPEKLEIKTEEKAIDYSKLSKEEKAKIEKELLKNL